MSTGFNMRGRAFQMQAQCLAGSCQISALGFVNRRSGVQSPRPAPTFSAYFRAFQRFSCLGTGGIRGSDKRFCQTQKPEQLFTARSAHTAAFAHRHFTIRGAPARGLAEPLATNPIPKHAAQSPSPSHARSPAAWPVGSACQLADRQQFHAPTAEP